MRYIGERPESERTAALGVLLKDPAWLKNPNCSARHIVERWQNAYGQGRTPVERRDRPGVASTAPTLDEVSTGKLEESLRGQQSLVRRARANIALGGSAADIGRRDEAQALATIAKLEAQLAARSKAA